MAVSSACTARILNLFSRGSASRASLYVVFTRLIRIFDRIPTVASRAYRFASNSIVCTTSGSCCRSSERSVLIFCNLLADPMVVISKTLSPKDRLDAPRRRDCAG